MSTQLSEFIGHVKQGMAKTTHFSVFFDTPKILPKSLFNGAELRKILLFCEQTQLPGLSLSTAPIKTFGEIREMPYEKTFDNLNMSFYVDRDMKVKQLFDWWISSIQDPTRRTFQYYDSYTVDIQIYVQDAAMNEKYLVTLHECYPKSVSPVQLDYNSKDVMRCQVSMNYKYWTSQLVTGTNASGIQTPGGVSGIISGVLAIPNSYWNSFVNFQQEFTSWWQGI